MDLLDDPAVFCSLASSILLMVLSSHHALSVTTVNSAVEDRNARMQELQVVRQANKVEVICLLNAALHSMQVWSSIELLGDDLGFWVKHHLVLDHYLCKLYPCHIQITPSSRIFTPFGHLSVNLLLFMNSLCAILIEYCQFNEIDQHDSEYIITTMLILTPKVLWHFSSKNHSKLPILEH